MSEGRVAWLHVAPVKSTALHAVSETWLDAEGARGDRSFFLVDERGILVNGTKLGRLVQVQADWDPPSGQLTLRMPDGESVGGSIRLGEPRTVTMFGNEHTVRSVLGPWSEALSVWAGRTIALVQPLQTEAAVDRGGAGGATLLGTASLEALAEAMGVERLDARRFRMLIGIDGLPAFGEDAWVGLRVGVGAATILVHGNVGRCAVTTQDPQTGNVDLPTLRVLQRLRGTVDATEPLPFGIWGEVVRPGRVALGDACGLDV